MVVSGATGITGIDGVAGDGIGEGIGELLMAKLCGGDDGMLGSGELTLAKLAASSAEYFPRIRFTPFMFRNTRFVSTFCMRCFRAASPVEHNKL